MPPSGVDPRDQRVDRPRIIRFPDRHHPAEGVVENQHAHLIDRTQIADQAGRRRARQLHLRPFHRRALIDDQHHHGAFGRLRRQQLRGQRAIQRVFRLLLHVVDIALAADHQQPAALLDVLLQIRLARRRNFLQIPIVQDAPVDSRRNWCSRCRRCASLRTGPRSKLRAARCRCSAGSTETYSALGRRNITA